MSVTFEDVESARARVGTLIRRTPCVPASNLARTYGMNLWLKLETLQVSGSFKGRGAANKLLSLPIRDQRRGVVTASAGNHAQRLALHASRLGIESTIVMPEYTPIVKVSRTAGYGGNVVLHGATFDEAAHYARQLCD